MVERSVRTTIDFIRKNISSSTSWSNDIEMIQLKINQRISSIHNSVPFEVLFARKFNSLGHFPEQDLIVPTTSEIDARIDRINNLIYPSILTKQEAVVKMRNSAWNKKHRLIEFQPGSLVMAKNPTPNSKFDAKYLGPFKIVSKTRGGSYTLAIATGELLPRNFPPYSLNRVLEKVLLNLPCTRRHLLNKLNFEWNDGWIAHT